jgi:TetR/AcrR family transcriptional regulator, transcriptional repressor for nem operon
VQEEAQRRVKNLLEFVSSALPDGVEQGQAVIITAAMVGALQLARTLGGKEGRALLANTREALLSTYQPFFSS